MRWTKIGTIGVVSLLIVAAVAAGQTAAKAPEAQKPLIPLKVDVTFVEYDGAKKISSLPYVLSVNANDRFGQPRTRLRMGLRIPISTGGNPFQYQYQEVGTNVDCSAKSLEGNNFEVYLSVQRSSLYSPHNVSAHGALKEFDADASPETNKESNNNSARSQPIFSSFSVDLNLLMRDGQTIQSTMATDPVSGRVLKVDVTLHVVK